MLQQFRFKASFLRIAAIRSQHSRCLARWLLNRRVFFARRWLQILPVVGTGVCVGVGAHYMYSGDVLRKAVGCSLTVHCKTISPEHGDIIPVDQERREKYNFIADTVEQVLPAVVYIECQIGSHWVANTSSGTGFFVRDDGLILTNAHIVSPAVHGTYSGNQRIEVKLQDGSKHMATVQCVDRSLDLATLKIDVKNVSHLRLGDSEHARVGEFVIAVGSPYSLSNTVTKGIISSLARSPEELHLNMPISLIQTDAMISQGNSGGPLLTLDGQVVGINCMTLAMASGFSASPLPGYSFAIPAHHAKKFLEQANKVEQQRKSGALDKEAVGKITGRRRPLGVTLLILDEQLSRVLRQQLSFQLPEVQSGLLIQSIIIGSPAYQAGLDPGDVIIAANDKPVRTQQDLFSQLERDEVTLTVWRKGQGKIKVRVSLYVDGSY